jgi:hypothetical protein
MKVPGLDSLDCLLGWAGLLVWHGACARIAGTCAVQLLLLLQLRLLLHKPNMSNNLD